MNNISTDTKDSISCKKATALMSKSMETKLSIREKAQLTAHLAICKTCSFCYRQFKSIRKTLVNYADAIFAHPDPNDHKLSDEATARMTRHLTKKSD